MLDGSTLHLVSNESDTDTATKLKLTRVFATLSSWPNLGFFEELKNYAKKLGIEVKSIESRRLQRLKNVLLWRAIRDHIKEGKNLDYNDKHYLSSQIEEIRKQEFRNTFPRDVYINMGLRTKNMITRTRIHQYEAVIVGGAHAIDIARAFGMTPRRITYVVNRRILKPHLPSKRGGYNIITKKIDAMKQYRTQYANYSKNRAQNRVRRRQS